jgi:fructoselysine 6-kinase
MTRMCAVGDNVIDWYPQENIAYPGGSAANSAVFARRLGLQSAYVGILGSDAQATFIADSLERELVDISHVQWRDESSSRTDVTVDDHGNRIFGAFIPPKSTIELNAQTRSFLEGAAWIHTGHSSFTEHHLEALAAIAPVSFDFSKKELDYAADLLPQVTYAAFSREDDTEKDCLDVLDYAVSRGVKFALVTRGSKGAIASTPEGIFTQPAAPAHVVDTIGAGDAFQTCFISGLSAGKSAQAALTEASQFAAKVCSYRGAFGSGQHMELAL